MAFGQESLTAVLQEKRQDAIDQLKAACLVLADALRAKGYKPEAGYRINHDGETALRISASGEYAYFYGANTFEQALVWIGALERAYSSENCAAWFQPEAVST